MNSKIRKILATVFFVLITLLFLDFTGSIHAWFGWMAKIQFLPAVLALNFGVVIALILLTLLMGRIYCSVICPLGVMQDIFGWFGKKAKKNRYTYSKPMNILRYVMLGVLVVALVAGVGSIAALLAPYSAFGRMASTFLAPIYQWGNNLLATWAESVNSYAFYSVDVWLKGGITFVVALVTLTVLFVLAFKNGRTYCNTICPVGTVLGFLSRFSYLKPVIDTSKCNGCGLCAKNCKASCIDSKNHAIDYSRCVVCLDCIDKCRQGAIKYVPRSKAQQAAPSGASADKGRRAFITSSVIVAGASVAKAQKLKMDGGFATIEDKQIPKRETPLTPPGSLSAKNLAQHCTACQLSEPGTSSVGWFEQLHATGNIVRTWLLSSGMYQVFGSMSDWCYQADYQGRKDCYPDWSCRMGGRKLYREQRWSEVWQLCPPLSDWCYPNGSEGCQRS